MLERLSLDEPVRRLIERGVSALVVVLFAIMALQNLGVELLPLIAGLGVAGAGIALAMQGVLGDLVAGLSIIFTRPFHIGEYISVVDEEGEVVDINLFSTVLKHTDRSRVVLPNRKIVGEVLHNYGTVRQLDVKVGVAYKTDLNKAMAVIREVLERNDKVMKDPTPVVAVVGFGDSSIDIAVKPWSDLKHFANARADLYLALADAFRENGIEIPFPQREIRVFNDSGPRPGK